MGAGVEVRHDRRGRAAGSFVAGSRFPQRSREVIRNHVTAWFEIRYRPGAVTDLSRTAEHVLGSWLRVGGVRPRWRRGEKPCTGSKSGNGCGKGGFFHDVSSGLLIEGYRTWVDQVLPNCQPAGRHFLHAE